ncbi:MAG: S41 family peptidase [Chloracidobacterium sp.]|nr:S41 family peptidase [Chloracidobacterium sp.]
MRRSIWILCVLAIALPTALTAQRTLLSAPGKGSDPDPFRIAAGSTFSASAPSGHRAEIALAATTERRQIVEELDEAQRLIQGNYAGGPKPRTEELTRSALTSLLHQLDPHSNFYDRSEWKALLDEQRSGYAGIGASLSTFARNSSVDTYIVSTFERTPARLAGLHFGDRIVAINGTNVEGRSTEETRDKIRGPIGTIVRITVERPDTGQRETVTVKRAIVEQPSVPDAYIIKPGVGYIDLSEGFSYTTDTEFGNALLKLKRAGMTSAIVDLRGNGGGLVDQAVKVAERFLPKGTLIVSQHGRTSADDLEWVSSNTAAETMPLVLLVDENTASASEIVAGAFQDRDRAIIVGERTFGKGLVQNVIDLPFKTGLTLTAARYYTPSGRSIQRDYEQISRYQYFSHLTPSADIGLPYYEAKTLTDRRVYGGNGISPDVSSEPVLMNAQQLALLDPIFAYANDLINGRVPGFESYAQYRTRQSSNTLDLSAMDLSDELISRLGNYKTADGAAISPKTITRDMDFIRSRLRHHLATSSVGSTLAKRVLNDSDPQIKAAIRGLPAAAELERAAEKAIRSGRK